MMKGILKAVFFCLLCSSLIAEEISAGQTPNKKRKTLKRVDKFPNTKMQLLFGKVISITLSVHLLSATLHSPFICNFNFNFFIHYTSWSADISLTCTPYYVNYY